MDVRGPRYLIYYHYHFFGFRPLSTYVRLLRRYVLFFVPIGFGGSGVLWLFRSYFSVFLRNASTSFLRLGCHRGLVPPFLLQPRKSSRFEGGRLRYYVLFLSYEGLRLFSRVFRLLYFFVFLVFHLFANFLVRSANDSFYLFCGFFVGLLYLGEYVFRGLFFLFLYFCGGLFYLLFYFFG